MEFQIGKYKYRTKELNAVEAFAMRTRLVFDDFDGSLEAINLVLEHLEVEIAGQWLPVKEKGKEMGLSIRLQREEIFKAMHRV